MKKRSFMQSLRGKITLQMLTVGLVPLIIVGIATFVVMLRLTGDFSRSLDDSRRIMEADVVGQNLAHRATMIMNDIDTYLHERMKDVLVWASAPTVVEAAAQGKKMAEEQDLVDLSLEEVEKKMEKTRTLNASPTANRYIIDEMKKSGVFKEIFFTEEHGFNVALTGLTSDFVQKGEEWWDIAWEQGIHVGDVVYDESAAVYSVEISARIDDPVTGKPLGVMKAVLDIGAVQTIASKVATEIKDSEVLIFRSDGLLLADTATDHDPAVIMSEARNVLSEGYEPAVSASKATEAEPSGFVLDEVAGYSHSAGSEFYADIPGFDGFNWGAVVRQQRDTAFAPIEGLVAMEQTMDAAQTFSMTLVVVVAVLVAASAAGLALLLARGIIQPVTLLSATADSISRGDLDVPIAVTSGDEIGDLAESIERMRASLKMAIERLRAR